MTNIELKALRRLFFLDVADAATYIGKCSKRAWQYWESGSRKIPDDVINIMNKLKEEDGYQFVRNSMPRNTFWRY